MASAEEDGGQGRPPLKAGGGQEPGPEKGGEKRAPLEGPARAEAPRLLAPASQPEFWARQVAGVTGRGRARWVGLLRLLF